jgi:predicted GNAT family acetyltransferase
MILNLYPDAAAFLSRAQAWLEEEEVANNLMLGVSLRERAFPERVRWPAYYATVEDQNGLIVAAVQTPPFKVIVYAGREDYAGALKAVARDLLASPDRRIPGVLGPNNVARDFAEGWTRLSGQSHRINHHQRIYVLHRVNPMPPVPGRVRLAGPAYLELATRWSLAFFEDIGESAGAENAEASARQRIEDGALHLWEDENGRPVSMAAAARPTAHGITVSLVYTPPESRRRGYAGACVAALSGAMLDAGYRFCTLFTDLANPTSNHIYQQIGYEPVCDYDEYEFAPPQEGGR